MFWRFDPFAEINQIFRNLSDLFRRTLAEIAAPSSDRLLPSTSTLSAASSFMPALDVYSMDGNLMVRCELPGVDPEGINVEVIGNRLKISGQKELAIQQDNSYLREADYGRFERTLVLPEWAKTDQIKANYWNGVLTITVPVEASIAPQKVKIEVAEDKAKAA